MKLERMAPYDARDSDMGTLQFRQDAKCLEQLVLAGKDKGRLRRLLRRWRLSFPQPPEKAQAGS